MKSIYQNVPASSINEERKYCIVTDDDEILERDLTHPEAEQKLAYFVGHEEDCFIGVTADFV